MQWFYNNRSLVIFYNWLGIRDSPGLLFLLRKILKIELRFTHWFFPVIKKTSENRLFWFVWKRGHYCAPFDKIRQNFTSLKARQCPSNRDWFCPIVYPIQRPETLTEHHYQGHFLRRRVSGMGFGQRIRWAGRGADARAPNLCEACDAARL